MGDWPDNNGNLYCIKFYIQKQVVREVGYTSREDSVSMIFDFSKVHEKENRKGKKKENKFANKKGFFW